MRVLISSAFKLPTQPLVASASLRRNDLRGPTQAKSIHGTWSGGFNVPPLTFAITSWSSLELFLLPLSFQEVQRTEAPVPVEQVRFRNQRNCHFATVKKCFGSHSGLGKTTIAVNVKVNPGCLDQHFLGQKFQLVLTTVLGHSLWI